MMRPVRIAPSILAADFAGLGEATRTAGEAGADMIHVDVMDGHFVPNITIGPGMVGALRPHTTLPLDVHLMIAPADPHIDAFADAGADILTVHPEAGPHLHRTLQRIRERGVRAGVALNPATPASAAMEVLDCVDLVLVMSVNPGFGGQKFQPRACRKLAELRAAIESGGHEVALEVDGGIKPGTAGHAIEAGADTLVAGSAVFGGDDPAARIAALRREG